MLNIESPPSVRGARGIQPEKRLKKRRELDALVKDVSTGRRRRRGVVRAATQELLASSSDCSSGDGRGQQRLGVTVWRGINGHKVFTVWWGLKWGLGASTVFLLASFSIWLHISTRFELDVVRRHVVRVDDDAKSVPETLEMIKNRLSALESNQTGVAAQLEKINTAISDLEGKIDLMNRSMSVAVANPTQLRQNVAELELGVGEVTKQLNVVVNRSMGNSESIVMLNKELITLKLNEIDMKNGESSSVASPSSNLTHLSSQLDVLNSKLAVNSRRLNTINSTALNIEHNSTVRINLEHDDVVAINGMVSRLQDDNLNVSSTLQSLNKSCSEQLHTLKVDIDILQEKVVKMSANQDKLFELAGEPKEAKLSQTDDKLHLQSATSQLISHNHVEQASTNS